MQEIERNLPLPKKSESPIHTEARESWKARNDTTRTKQSKFIFSKQLKLEAH